MPYQNMFVLTFNKFILIILVRVGIIMLLELIRNLVGGLDNGIDWLGFESVGQMGQGVTAPGLTSNIILLFFAIFCARAFGTSLSMLMVFFLGLMLTCSVAMLLNNFHSFPNNHQSSYKLSNSP